jgi:hypothetical protein
VPRKRLDEVSNDSRKSRCAARSCNICRYWSALLLEFQKLLLRAPVPPEGDVVLTAVDLSKFAGAPLEKSQADYGVREKLVDLRLDPILRSLGLAVNGTVGAKRQRSGSISGRRRCRSGVESAKASAKASHVIYFL